MCVAGRTRESPIPGSTRGERGSALWLSLSLLLYRLGLDRQRPAFLAVMMVGMYLKVAPEIRRALQGGRPVVALESTIITHGMPYPENLETARSLESQVRAGGAVPATIAVIGGVICAGLSDTELEWLATAQNVLKLSRNDLPHPLAPKKIGAPTAARTRALTFRRTWRNWRARRWRWSAPAPRRCPICPRRWSTLRRAGSR